ncbi:MAG: non-homologous end-joining DNA ligase [Candidatus Margulisiibacteriota bacterium]|jgi:bifunctional non-homologous end joining protein LigD
MNKKNISINDRELSLSNPEKILYPAYGFTKVRILEYYSRVARFILPHLKDRALTLKRYPQGVDQEYFFEKRCPAHRPNWVKTAALPYGKDKKIAYCLANNLETLIWLENLASIELHVPLARAASYRTPDAVVFDLDPGDGADILDCARVALILKELLARQHLLSWVKTSGRKGLHVFVPLNSKGTSFENTKSFSRAVAETMQNKYPDLVTARMDKKYRRNKVFINWSQNDASKTMVCAYSLRAEEKPYVSCPLKWPELEKLLKLKKPDKFQVLAAEAVKRVGKDGDLFREVLTKKQRLPNV